MLLTRKLLKFLSRLYEMRSGCAKISVRYDFFLRKQLSMSWIFTDIIYKMVFLIFYFMTALLMGTMLATQQISSVIYAF